jgi:hypothetical protein
MNRTKKAFRLPGELWVKEQVQVWEQKAQNAGFPIPDLDYSFLFAQPVIS